MRAVSLITGVLATIMIVVAGMREEPINAVLFSVAALILFRQAVENRLPNRVCESVTHLSVNPYTIRVWRTEADLSGGNNEDLREWAYHMQRTSDAEEINAAKLCQALETFPRVCAVEVTVGNHSTLLYPDWA